MKKILLFVCLSILGSVTLFAQIGAAPQIVNTTEKSAIHVPPQEVPAALKKIYSNLGTKADLYNDTHGWLLAGPNSNNSEFVAMPFTPKFNSHVSEVQVPVQYIEGDNQVNLSIYADSGADYPGTLLAGPVTVTNLADYGTCCALAVADFTPVAVTAGTQYWVVGDTPSAGTGSDFMGTWDWVVKNLGEWASGSPYGWSGIPVDGEPAGEVLGTIP